MIAVLSGLIALASPNPYPTLPPAPSQTAPPFPPDGTYRYRLSRDGKAAGETVVVVMRRASDNRFDLFEAGAFGNIGVRLRGALSYSDLQPNPWDVTYAGIPLPTGGRLNQKYGSVARYTVRYEIDQDGSFNVVDGVPGGDVWPLWSFAPEDRHVKYFTVVDPPFMASLLTVMPTQRMRKEGYVFSLSEPLGVHQQAIRQIAEKTAWANAPSGDLAIATDEFTLWYDPVSLTVHAAFFPSLGVTATLEKYEPSTAAAIPFGAP